MDALGRLRTHTVALVVWALFASVGRCLHSRGEPSTRCRRCRAERPRVLAATRTQSRRGISHLGLIDRISDPAIRPSEQALISLRRQNK